MRRIVLLLTLVAVAVAIPAAASGHHVKAKTHTVKTGDDYFSPTKRTIHLKDVVKWVWVGADGRPGETFNEHTIAESKGRFSSDTKTSGTFKFRFRKTGKFTILCADHPETMRLTVTVKR